MGMRQGWRGCARLVVLLFGAGLLLAGCKSPPADDETGSGGSPPPGGGNPPPGSGPITALQIELPADPTVAWKPGNGTTQVITQYIVRDQNGTPLDEAQFDVVLKVDNKPLDNESLLDKSSTELAVNLFFSMVLDASYSMLTPPAAFEPMKSAARESYQTVLDTWQGRPGATRFSLMWFADVANVSLPRPPSDADWLPSDIMSIPSPQSGDFTKLYSAVSEMSRILKKNYDDGIFNGPRDQYELIVFSDGADNHSWFDKGSAIDQPLTTSSGAPYRQYSMHQATTLQMVKDAVKKVPTLTVNVIGMGPLINEQELQEIADAGGGIFLKNPTSENLDELFARIIKEFTTIQTQGAQIPLPPADYVFTIAVSDKSGAVATQMSFSFHGGDENARLLSLNP